MPPDISLEEKEAFYAQIDPLDKPSDGEEESLQRDRELRDKIRGFFNQANTIKTSQVASKSRTTLDVNASRRLQRSRSTPSTIATHNSVIEATPSISVGSRQVNQRRDPVSTSFIEDTPRQNTRAPGTARLKHSLTNPVSLPRNNSNQSSTVSTMGKRKRNSKIPENEQVLQGLRLFYIPDNQANKLRRQRMEHAQKYGAELTKDLASATHVVVDENLTYKDIRSSVSDVLEKGETVVVKENYPLDCITERRILLPENFEYRVKGLPIAQAGSSRPQATSLCAEPTTSQASKRSLELKAPTAVPGKWNYIPPRTPSQSEASSLPHHDGSVPKGSAMALAPSPRGLVLPSLQTASGDEGGNDEALSLSENERRPGPIIVDELSQLIDDVQKNFKDLPPIGDEDADLKPDDKDSNSTSAADDSEAASEDEKRQKRQRKGKKSKTNLEEHFACSRGGTKDQAGGDNPNAKVIAKLQKMLDYYTRTNDQWRTLAYRRGINTLSRHAVRVTTAAEARELPYIGERLALKIEEIANTDRLKRLDYAEKDSTSQVLNLFLGIYGVGTATADRWIAQGFRTLDDLVEKAKLTPNQLVGIEHYDDLNSRIPRAEVKALGDFVRKEASQIDKDVELIIGGSYRRGADSSGDIDFIITKKGTTSSADLISFLDKLVRNLTQNGFLTAELASHNSYGSKHSKDGNGSKWHGCCVLPRIPGSSNDNDSYRPAWRRIDFLLVAETEYGAALIYFTGNDIFNRSMRLLASRKKMRLNQRGLYKDVIRGYNRDKIAEGDLVEGRSEKRIFEILGVKWREPQERWC